MPSEEAKVILVYGDHFFERKRRRPHTLSPRHPPSVEIAKRFLAWCSEHMVDYEEMIDLRFTHLWKLKRQCPQFNALRAPSLLPFARKQEASKEAAALQVVTFDQTVRDLTYMTPTHEQVRQRYFMQQQAILCKQNTAGGGYDPRSRYCPHCPQAFACAQRLNKKWGFDVTALRAGKLHLLPAPVRKVLRGWDGRISV